MDAAIGEAYWTPRFAEALQDPEAEEEEGEGRRLVGLEFIQSDVGTGVLISTGRVRGCASDCLWQSLALLTGMMTKTDITHPHTRARDNRHTWTMFLQGACMATEGTVERANVLAAQVREQVGVERQISIRERAEEAGSIWLKF
jgi:hypothetical protein